MAGFSLCLKCLFSILVSCSVHSWVLKCWSHNLKAELSVFCCLWSLKVRSPHVACRLTLCMHVHQGFAWGTWGSLMKHLLDSGSKSWCLWPVLVVPLSGNNTWLMSDNCLQPTRAHFPNMRCLVQEKRKRAQGRVNEEQRKTTGL